MKTQRDKLQQYQRRITVLTDKETEVARQMLAKKDKKRALLALRRKKYQESLLAKTDAQLAQLEQLTSNVEFALIQKDVIFGLQQGTKVLKEIHAEMGGIENVEKLMGENADAIAYQKVYDASRNYAVGACLANKSQEVSDMLGGRMSTQDEEDVEDELAELQAELAAEKSGPELPSVPHANVPVAERRPEEEERQEAPALVPA